MVSKHISFDTSHIIRLIATSLIALVASYFELSKGLFTSQPGIEFGI